MKIPVWDKFFIGGGAETFFSLLTSFRLLWGAGGFGSGKTLLAVLVSAELIHRRLVERVYSNIDIKGKSPVEEFVPDGSRYYSNNLRRWFYAGERFPIEDAAIVMDEAHLFLDTWKDAKAYVSALRKANLYMLMPSIWPPHVRLRVLEVRRVLNLYAFGIPGWYYSWALTNGQVVEKGNFTLWRPDRVFSIYNTADFPADDGGIVDGMKYTFGLDKVMKYGSGKTRYGIGGPDASGTAAPSAGDFAAIEDAINSIPDAYGYSAGYGRARNRR